MAFDLVVFGFVVSATFNTGALGAAFGLVQLSKLNNNLDLRAEHYANMRSFFEQYEEYFILPKQLPNSRTGWLAFAVTIRDSAPFKRTELQIFLEKRKPSLKCSTNI